MIIGISGRKGSGKSTVAEGLRGRLEGAVVVCFGDKLKEIVSECFGVPLERLYGSEESKNLLAPCGLSGRELLQLVGTEQFRNLWPKVWVHCWRKRVEAIWSVKGPVPILAPDVRFRDELLEIERMGGFTLRLTRVPYPKDKHKSEVALDCWRWPRECVIDNRTQTAEETVARAMEVVREKGVV